MPRRFYNRYAHMIQDRRLARLVSEYLRGAVLDLGCGVKPYSAMLRPTVSRHVGVDMPISAHGTAAVDAFAVADELPFAPEAFDGILGTNVLEHLSHPDRALSECKRVLRPEGWCVFTTPFLWHVHEAPRDYFRYTRYGLELLLREAGFERVQVFAVSGFWGTFGQLLAYNLHRIGTRWPWALPFLIPPILGSQVLGAVLDKVDKDERWTFLYMSIARKPREHTERVDSTAL